MIEFYPLGKLVEKYSDEIHDAVLRAAFSGRYLLGPEVERFERMYADYIGTRHCVACASGLDAL